MKTKRFRNRALEQKRNAHYTLSNGKKHRLSDKIRELLIQGRWIRRMYQSQSDITQLFTSYRCFCGELLSSEFSSVRHYQDSHMAIYKYARSLVTRGGDREQWASFIPDNFVGYLLSEEQYTRYKNQHDVM